MKHWIPSVILALLIFFLSNESSLPGSDLAPDYVAHFCVYGLLSLTVLWGLTAGLRRKLTAGLAAVGFVITTAYGFTDEFHQMFIPGRNPAWSDIAADTLGAACFILLAVVAVRLWLRRAETAVLR